MIVKTLSGTVYEFRFKTVDVTDMQSEKPQTINGGWEGIRYSTERRLHIPIPDWWPVRITLPPEVGLCMRLQYEGYEVMNTSPVTLLEITDAEKEALHA